MHPADSAALPPALSTAVARIFQGLNRDPSFLVVFDSAEDSVRVLEYALQFGQHHYQGQFAAGDELWDLRLYTLQRPSTGRSPVHIVTAATEAGHTLYWLDEMHAPE